MFRPLIFWLLLYFDLLSTNFGNVWSWWSFMDFHIWLERYFRELSRESDVGFEPISYLRNGCKLYVVIFTLAFLLCLETWTPISLLLWCFSTRDYKNHRNPPNHLLPQTSKFIQLTSIPTHLQPLAIQTMPTIQQYGHDKEVRGSMSACVMLKPNHMGMEREDQRMQN